MAIRKIVSRSITDGAVVAADVAALSVDATKLASNAVTNAKIATGAISTDKLDSTAQRMGFKNRIINGAMVIDQRNAGASVTPTLDATYTLDRWGTGLSASSKYSVQQNAGSVTPPPGFTNYLGVTSLASTSLGTNDYYLLFQKIEGYNSADLDFGKSTAKTITISFWVRSSLTGTFGASIYNNAANRCYPFNYTIASANTWTQASVTIAGDTTGTWLTTNGAGLQLIFSLGAGSSYSRTANTWTSDSFIFQPTGSVSLVGTSGATLYITGVQLEVGSTSTAFDYRSYGTELALCQRYYYQLLGGTLNNISVTGYCFNTTQYNAPVVFPTQMRAAPSLNSTSGSGYYYLDTPSGNALGAWSIYNANKLGALIYTSVAAGAGGYSGGIGIGNANASIAFSAEL